MLHEFNIQMKKASNVLKMKYSPKRGHYCYTLSITNIVLVSVGIHSVVHEHFWCDFDEELDITITISPRTNIATKDCCQTLNSILK